MAARRALVCFLAFVGLVVSANGQSQATCIVKPAAPLRSLWTGWTPDAGNGLSEFIDPVDQNTTVATAEACNCKCEAISSCVGYVVLGGSQCWLQSQIKLTLDTTQAASLPTGTTVARVAKDGTNTWPVCKQLKSSQINITFTGNPDPTTTVASEAACNQQCGNQNTCIAYNWVAANKTCTTFSTVNGFAPQNGTTSAFLQACGEHLVAPPTLPSVASTTTSCNIDGTPGFVHVGQLVQGWRRLKNAGNATVTYINNEDIPDAAQAQPATSAAECNCKCRSIKQCVGYTWLGKDSQECWLHSFVDWSRPTFTSYLDWANNTQVPVAKDAVMGRLITDTEWPQCVLMSRTDNATFLKSSSDKINKQPKGQITVAACNAACGNDPACVGWSRVMKDTLSLSELAECKLYSSVQEMVATPSVDGKNSLVGVLNHCLEELPATYASAVPSTLNLPPPPPAPTPQAFKAQSTNIGSCQIDARPGIRYQGKVWAGFANQVDVGAQVVVPAGITSESITAPSVYSSPISTRNIPGLNQGKFMQDPADCNCKCMQTDTCVGYVWLGSPFQTCWMLSWIYFWADPTDTFTDYSQQAQPVVANVPPDTVSGRVVKFNDNDAAARWNTLSSTFGTPASKNITCNQLLTNWRSAPKTSSSDKITRQPNKPVVPNECNAACLLDPYCVAFTWAGMNYDEKAACTLLSDVSGGLVDVPAGATTQNFAAVVQTCPGDQLNISDAFTGVNITAPTDASASCGVSSSVGVSFKGLVWRDWVPVYGFGGDLTITNAGAPQASNAFIPDTEQGKVTPSADECNCRCAKNDACIAWTWLPVGGGKSECWLHSSVNFWSTPANTFLDPNNNSTSGYTAVPPETVIGRVVFPPGNNRATVGCGFTNRPSAIPEASFSNPVTTGLIQPTKQLTIDQCNTQCLQQPKCTQFIYQTKAPSLGLDLGNCTLLVNSSGYVDTQPQLGFHFFAATAQVCSTALKASPSPPTAPAPPPASSNATAASWSAGVRYMGVVWPGWQRVYRAGWQTSDGTSWSDTPSSSRRRLLSITTTGNYSNNYIPDDKQALKTSTAEQCNQACASVKACIAYTWLGGSIQECWLQSFVQFWQTPTNTYIDANGIAQPVPEDTVIARVIRPAADWAPCKADMSWFPKLAPINGSSAGITSVNPVSTSDISKCNAACGADPACIAFSFNGPVPVDGSPVNCMLYSNITGGLTVNSSRTGISYTVPLQSCPQDLQSLSGAAPTPPGFNPDLAAAGSSSKKSLSTGALAGIVVGCVLGALAILLIVAVFWTRHSKQKERENFYGSFGHKSSISGDTKDSIWSLGMTGETAKHVPMAIPGLAKGEIFTRATAYEYSWLMNPLDENQVQAVEANINDKQLDSMLKNETNPNALPPVVEMSKEDLKNNVQLVHGGLLGRGATALVFQCVWPSRFGPNALLAVKVLKDGHEVDPLVLQSFAYEANVLASTEHPCVVRLYGYCLEPPTVCLILELLPYSLKDLLYGIQTQADSTTRAMHPTLRGLSLNSSNPLLLTHFTNTSGMQTPKSEAPVVVVVDEDGKSTTASPAVVSRDTLTSTNQSLPTSPETGSSVAAPLLHTVDSRPPPLQIENNNRDTGLNGTVMTTPVAGPMPSPGSRPPPLSMLQVVRISAEIAAGLAYLHDRQLYNVSDKAPIHAVVTLESSSGLTTTMNQQGLKIVHRDLKPANILMNSQGRAKISDFGLARKTQRTTVHTERLGAGTLPYMAPELLAGANSGNTYKLAPTNRVDIYSLSMMMWEMISGKQPWSDKNEVAIMSAVIRNQRPELPQMPREVMEGAKPDLEHLPASLYALPEFNTLVRATWNQRELKRPTAAALYHKLAELLRSYGYNPPADLVVMTPSLGPQEPEESPV